MSAKQLSPALIEQIHAANLANIARKVQGGKTLTPTEQKQLDSARHASHNAMMETAKQIVSDGIHVMAAVADIIRKSKLPAPAKKAIFTQIASITDRCTEI